MLFPSITISFIWDPPFFIHYSIFLKIHNWKGCLSPCLYYALYLKNIEFSGIFLLTPKVYRPPFADIFPGKWLCSPGDLLLLSFNREHICLESYPLSSGIHGRTRGWSLSMISLSPNFRICICSYAFLDFTALNSRGPPRWRVLLCRQKTAAWHCVSSRLAKKSKLLFICNAGSPNFWLSKLLFFASPISSLLPAPKNYSARRDKKRRRTPLFPAAPVFAIIPNAPAPPSFSLSGTFPGIKKRRARQ